MPPLTTEQQTAYDSIDQLLDNVNIKSTSVSTPPTFAGPGSKFPPRLPPATLGERIDRAVNAITEINKKDNPQPADIKRRDELAKAIVDADAALKGLSEQEKAEVFGGGTSAKSDKALSAANALKNASEVAKAVEANRVQSFESEEVKDQDLTDGEGDDLRIIRTAYQCFLLYNINYFSNQHKTLLISGDADPSSAYRPATSTGEIRTTGYIKGGGSTPRIYLLSEDTNSTIVNNKLSFCPGNDRFSKIQTHEYAQLQPLLRLYKVYRNYQPPGQAASGKDALVEFQFRNKTGLEGILGQVATIQPDGSTSQAFAKGTEVGVKSFDWRYLGSDPFTATRDIEATLVLHAQHFSSLTTPQNAVDLNGNFTSNQLQSHKYLDLILQPDCKDRASSTTRQSYNNFYEPGCYEIRVDVGYAPQNGDLRDAVCCQQDTLYLVHVDHKFDFAEDGTMNLTINYRGRLEATMNDKKFNVLLPGGGFDTSDNKTATAPLIAGYNRLEKKLDTARKKEDEKEIKRLERVREALFVDLRQYQYAIIMETMEDQKMIHSFELTPDEFERFARWKEPKYKAALPDLIDPLSRTAPKSGAENTVAVGFKSATKAYNEDPEKSNVTTTTDRIQEVTEEQVRQRLADAIDDKQYVVNFMYLGDLIATVLANTLGEIPVPAGITSKWKDPSNLYSFLGIGSRGGSTVEQEIQTTRTSSSGRTQITRSVNVSPYKTQVDNFHMMLGVIDYTDGNGVTKQVNLAHIPVSLESFQDFMLKNVITPNSDYYSLSDFLDDLITDLVTNMFSNECFNGLLSVDSRTTTTTYTSKTPLNPFLYYRRGPPATTVSSVHVSEVDKNTLPFGKDSRCSEMKGEPKQYLVVNTLNTHPRNLAGTLKAGVRGDPIGDEQRGILHFTYGENQGLLKKASFSKTDQEFLPEARYAAGGSILNQLSNVYDVNFEMVGNNIFKPGMLIYFDPSPIGAGYSWQFQKDANGNVIQRSWANIMGIGGYHLVTEVAHGIGPGKFDTSVKARWVASGENTLLTSQTNPGIQGA